jgi:hypothetical protein
MNRLKTPDAWAAAVLSFWEERRDGRPKDPIGGWKRNTEFVRLINSIDDLRAAFTILRTVKQNIPQIFLATRPAYMSKESPQWEPCHTGYLALLEGILEDKPGVTMASAAELDAFWTENAGLIQLNTPQLRQAIQGRWQYEKERMLRRKQRAFKDELWEELVAGAMHPKRVQHILDHYDMDGLMATFGE